MNIEPDKTGERSITRLVIIYIPISQINTKLNRFLEFLSNLQLIRFSRM